ncbi:MAG: ABC transporter ATP-binding protein [Thermoanaerobaculum sp.]|nr:ABC transporter ATP-binding protein [Thermoanaerobaculum sp.]MDW7967958.1 ABC transporter ATP-binding protein [Thermoanaerobaculum sp.]
MTPALELCQLEVHRGTFRLGPLNLALSPGEYLVILGPSGAGKTILLQTLAGWHSPARGSLRWHGTELALIPRTSRRCAFLSQNVPLLPHLTVVENLRFGVACRGESVDPHLEDHLVVALGLTHCLKRRDIATLSRGEQQRLALAQALLTRPQLLLLDEPSTALDPHRKPELWQLLRQLHRQLGGTVVHVTHDRQEAFFLGHRIAVLLAGSLQQVAPPQQLYRHPANLAVARFLAPENLWPIQARQQQQQLTRVLLADPPVELRLVDPGHGSHVGIRPEEVALIDPQRPLGPQVRENLFAAQVQDLVFLDGQAQVHLRTREGLPVVARLPLCTALDRQLQAGSQVHICLKQRSLYLVGDVPRD